MKSYFSLFRNYANFSGFMKRGAYWMAMIIHWLILLIPLVPGIFFLLNKNDLLPAALNIADETGMLSKIYIPWVLPLWCFYFLLMVIPVWSATVRRLHSLPKSGWWLLLGLIPVIGSFILLIWLLQKGGYEDLLRRLKRARGENDLLGAFDNIVTIAAKPRNGGWFFVVFVLLAVGGWFLNREILRTGTHQTVMAAFQTVSENGLASLKDFVPAQVSVPVQTPAADPVSDKKDAEKTPADADVKTTVPVKTEIRTAEGEKPLEEAVEGAETPEADIITEDVSSVLLPTAEVAEAELSVTEETTEDASDTTVGRKASAIAASVSETEPVPEKAAVQVKPGQAVIAKQDGSILLLTEKDVLASVYAVTVEQYQSCVADGVCELPEALYRLAYPEEENAADKLPMVYVDAGQAASYCEWAGMRLPSADEWKAAAKLADNAAVTASSMNVVGTNRRTYIHSEDQHALTVPVTAFRSPSSAYGMVQMIGNVWEWTAPEGDGADVALGGAWNSYPAAAGPDAEIETFPGYATDNIGFRCFVDMNSLDPEKFEVSEDDVDVLLNPGLWSSKGVRAKDNAKMVYIPSAVFNMGVTNGQIDEKPVHEVTLSAYWIDAYEVNNEQYALCVAEGACTEPHETKSLRQASYYGNPAFSNYPVIAVDRQQAAAYCEWAGMRLPTEAEWEYAAKGPDETAYPWGAAFVSGNLNYSGNGNYDTLAVNANPEDVSAFGVYDLGGNVSEWVSDRYQENWYSVTNQPIDPTGPENGNYYVIRGGSAQTGDNNARTTDRFYGIGTSFGLDRGFRCAVSEN